MCRNVQYVKTQRKAVTDNHDLLKKMGTASTAPDVESSGPAFAYY
jgi:hypothetical protein